MKYFSVHRNISMARYNRCRGASLIEILITMLIVSFALLGVAGMQLTSVRYSQASIYRETASNLAQSMIEKISANSLALGETDDSSAYRADDGYAAATTIVSDPGCGLGTTLCTTAESAQRDLREWRLALQRELPGGRGALQPVTSGGLTSPTTRRVIVMWLEKAKDSDDNLSAAPTDTNCPTPRVAGVRCITLIAQP
jgi:type IV pilus assembly protein PilV